MYAKWHSLVIILFVYLYDVSRAQTVPCQNELTINSEGLEFEWQWQKQSNYVVSQRNLCWHNNDRVQVRQCDALQGKWLPQQVSCSVLSSSNRKCPEELTELRLRDGKFVCLKISKEPQEFSEKFCYGSDYILRSENQEVIEYLRKQQIFEFWLPLQKVEDNIYKSFVIRLPGKHWNRELDGKIHPIFAYSASEPGGSSLENCAIAKIDEETKTEQSKTEQSKTEQSKTEQIKIELNIVSCWQQYHSVCIFKDHFVAATGCPQNFGALSYRPNECYGISWANVHYPQNEFRMLSVPEYYERLNALDKIFKKHKIDVSGEVQINGTLDEDADDDVGGEVTFPELNNYLWLLNLDKQQLRILPNSNPGPTGILSVEHIENRKNVEMILKWHTDLEALVLTVYNRFYVWSNDRDHAIHCFCKVNYDELDKVSIHKIWENNGKTKTLFKLELKHDDEALYWCEAHTIFDFSLVRSASVLSAKENRGPTFVIRGYVPCEEQCLRAGTKMKAIADYVRAVLKKARKSVEKKLEIHDVRIIEFSYVDGTPLMLIHCHVTVSLDKKKAPKDEQTRLLELLRLLLITMYSIPGNSELGCEIKSLEFCLPDNNWPMTRRDEVATTLKFCLRDNGLPYTRNCLTDLEEGASWNEDDDSYELVCSGTEELKQTTKKLYDLAKTDTLPENTVSTAKSIKQMMARNLSDLIPADVFYLAKVMQKTITLKKEEQHEPELNATDALPDVLKDMLASKDLKKIKSDILSIYNYLMDVADDVLKPANDLNSINILLEHFENFMDTVTMEYECPTAQCSNETNINPTEFPYDDLLDDVDVVDYLDIGVSISSVSNILIFEIDPSVHNVSGIALFQRDEDDDDDDDDADADADGIAALLHGSFANIEYRFLMTNESSEALLNDPKLQIASFVPESLWQRLDEIAEQSNSTLNKPKPKPKIVIKIYANDKLFIEKNYTEQRELVFGRVISISIPGHSRDLPDILPLIINVGSSSSSSNASLNSTEQNQQRLGCSYWNYANWASDGLSLIARSDDNQTILCGCTHLTPFAYLISDNSMLSVDIPDIIYHENKERHEKALDIITILGCSLSFLGIIGIFVTAGLFSSWRRKANSKLIIQLSLAIALQMVLFCFVNTEENFHYLISNKIFNSCIAVGTLLHYSILVQFCWMVIIAYLQFQRYVIVLGNTRPKRFIIKSSLLGWGLPLLPVGLVLAIDKESYLTNKICYPSGNALYFGVVLPITLAICINLIIFFVVIYNILKNSPGGTSRHREKSLALSQLRLLVLLFFLLGFTWIFGLLTAIKAGILFSYLFCFTATLQGFILFVYFIVMDPATRNMWHGQLRKLFGLKEELGNSSCVKESSQQTF